MVDLSKLKPEDIKGVECRFATHCTSNFGNRDDLHVVKEVITLQDGTTVPNVRLLKNYKRPFWVTRKGFQNHKQKKEWEHQSKLMEYKCTQADLVNAAAAALGRHGFTGNLRRLARDPYLYGADILSTAVIKREYQTRYPNHVTPYSVACTDAETDVIGGTNEITMMTLSCKERVYTVIQKSYFEGYSDVVPRLQEAMQKYLGEIVKQRNIKWEIEFAENEGMLVKALLNKAHEWKPDFMAIWNMDFDIPKMVQGLEKYGLNVADAFSDPKVPSEFRFFKYKQGPKQKVTASGKITPIKPAAQWHTVFTPASFYVIDAMCAYRHIRTGQPEESSYSLDYILGLKLNLSKLKFEKASQELGHSNHTFDWHQLMQSKYKFEYVIYNVFDCISMELLDEKTKDLSLTIGQMAGCSDFQNFKSQPRRVVDELHYFVQKHNRVIGTTSDEMENEFDSKTIGLNDWIIMLPAHLVADNGLSIVEEDPTLKTNIRRSVADLDVAAS